MLQTPIHNKCMYKRFKFVVVICPDPKQNYDFVCFATLPFSGYEDHVLFTIPVSLYQIILSTIGHSDKILQADSKMYISWERERAPTSRSLLWILKAALVNRLLKNSSLETVTESLDAALVSWIVGSIKIVMITSLTAISADNHCYIRLGVGYCYYCMLRRIV